MSPERMLILLQENDMPSLAPQENGNGRAYGAASDYEHIAGFWARFGWLHHRVPTSVLSLTIPRRGGGPSGFLSQANST